MPPPRARSSTEEWLYIELARCPSCGRPEFGARREPTRREGRWLSDFHCHCPNCDAHWITTVEVSERIPQLPGEAWSERTRASELLDPGQWLAVADAYAGPHAGPGRPALDTQAMPGLDPGPTHPVDRVDLGKAASAVEEAMLFLPDGQDDIPAEALRSDLGRAMYDSHSERFGRQSLEDVRDRYRLLSGEVWQDPPGPVSVRSTGEASAYLGAFRCPCGDDEIVVDLERLPEEGEHTLLLSRCCAACDARSIVAFSLPEDDQDDQDGEDLDGSAIAPAGAGPSTVLDAGQWLRLGSAAARQVSDAVGRLSEDVLADPDTWWAVVNVFRQAVDCHREVARFVPGSTGRVPASGFWTSTGRALLRDRPQAFTGAGADQEVRSHKEALRRFLGEHPEPEDD